MEGCRDESELPAALRWTAAGRAAAMRGRRAASPHLPALGNAPESGKPILPEAAFQKLFEHTLCVFLFVLVFCFIAFLDFFVKSSPNICIETTSYLQDHSCASTKQRTHLG